MKIVFVGNGPSGSLSREQIRKIESVGKGVEVSLDQRMIPEADILINPPLDGLNYQSLPNLKWIHVQSAGINRMPKELRDSNILLTNSSGVHPIPISEMVWAYILMWGRQINQTFRHQIVRHEWVRDIDVNEMGEVFGKTMMIVGLGHIGGRVAEIAKAFNMRVIGVVRNPKRKEKNVSLLISTKEMDKYLKECDFVVDCLPGTDETKGTFDLKRFKEFKKGSFFVNIGRGTTVVEKDLIEALKSGLVAGAGLDVFETEPLPKNSPLWKMDNVILTPHISGHTPLYTDRVVEIFCQNLKAYLNKKPMPNLVDKKLGY